MLATPAERFSGCGHFLTHLFLWRQEITELETDLAAKRALMAKNTAMLTAAEEKFKTLKDEQLRAIYNPEV